MHPALMRRSETSPALSPAQSSVERTPAKTPLKIETTRVKDDVDPQEICLSPSWSDSKKRKKEKRQREKELKELKDFEKKVSGRSGMKRELSKKYRKEEEKGQKRAAEVKAGRRLSKKPPPAAMDTQKMPMGLRRNSLVSMFSSRSSSREGSRRNSLSGDEKRLSGISLSSFATGRSQSTQPTSDEAAPSIDKYQSTISPVAPRLPSFNWRSRKSPSEASRGVSWVSEDAYDKEVVEFAYRLDASAFIAEAEKIERKRSHNEQKPQHPRRSYFKEHTEVNGISRSATEPALMSSTPGSTVPQAPPKSPRRSQTTPQDCSAQKAVKIQESNSTVRDCTAKVSHAAAPDRRVNREAPIVAAKKEELKRPEATPPQQQRPAMHVRMSHDGSSYVQKQRLYQQQMSIAGFEDQETVQRANQHIVDSETAKKIHEWDSRPSDESLPIPVEVDATPKPRHSDRPDSQVTIVTPSPGDQVRKDPSSQSKPSVSTEPQKATLLSNGKTAAEIPEKTSANMGDNRPTPAEKSVAPVESLPSPESKTHKTYGFRKRSKPPPAKIWVAEEMRHPTDHQLPMSAPPNHVSGPATKRSKLENPLSASPLSSPVPAARKRAGSAGSETLMPPPAELFRKHTRNRTNSSEALTPDLPSPVPKFNPFDSSQVWAKQSRGQSSPLVSPMTNVHKFSVENKAELDTNSNQPHKQSTEGIDDAASRPVKSIQNHLVDADALTEDISNQKSSTKVKTKTDDAKELTRYELVETFQPKAKVSNPIAPVEIGPSVAEKAIVSEPTLQTPSPGATKPKSEIVVESVSNEGVVRKMSITRPRSNPHLPMQQSASTSSLPSLDFLPQLKHQPLVKRTSPPRTNREVAMLPGSNSLGSLSSSPANSRLLAATATGDLPTVLPRSPLRPSPPNSPLKYSSAPTTTTTISSNGATTATATATPSTSRIKIPPIFNRSSTSIPASISSTSSSTSVTSLSSSSKVQPPSEKMASPGVATAKPVAKLFVICCKCKFWHDLPSKLYEAMALPSQAVAHHQQMMKNDKDQCTVEMKTSNNATSTTPMATAAAAHLDPTANVNVNVKCPWCDHGMTTWCCQGWTAVVYLHQRHH